MSDKTFLARLRTAFFTGLMLLAPLGVTIIVFVWLVSQVGGTFRNYFFFWVPVTSATKKPSRSAVRNSASRS